MPEFQYSARTATGAVEKSTITAFSEKSAVEALRARGLMPMLVKPAGFKLDLGKIQDSFGSVKLIDKITFIKNLSVMTKAGLPVSKTLKILSEQATNKKFGKILTDVAHQVESGTSLANAMDRYPDVFSKIFVSMVRVGEVSGNLEQNLKYLSDQLQRDYAIMSKAKGALTYPVMVLIALAIVGVVMFTFVLPKLTSAFKEMSVELPMMTKVIIGSVDFMSKYGIFVVLFLILAGFGFVFWRRTPGGKVVIHKAVLVIPMINKIVIEINTARFVRVFSSLIKSGMAIVDALEISASVLGNIYYQKAITTAAGKVRTGSPLSAGFKREPKLFSSLVVQMMEVGEESGTTDVVLSEVAEFYETEVDERMKNISTIIEPLIMIVVGTIVGFVAVGLISPIYNISQGIG